ncbi:MAG: hypothetical protein RLY86_2686 [Pseudomonadota bacterium]|jgi:NAD(P)-dependent dehydrogenase (short-subunit alcohol dehydrogenase family)
MVQRVIVTGGFGALGRAVGAAFLADGAAVALIDRAADAPAPVAALGSTGPLTLLCGQDLATEAGAAAAVAAAADTLGGLDVVITVAGGFRWETVADGSVDSWDALYTMNVRTCLNTCRAAIGRLGPGGRIITVGANAAREAALGMGAYAASKAGVMRLTEALAAELKPRGITVNAVLPAIIDTPANRADMPEADFSQWTSPEAIADVMVFLASAKARAITGALIPVTNGG